MPKLNKPVEEDLAYKKLPHEISATAIIIVPRSKHIRTKKGLPKEYASVNARHFTLVFQGDHYKNFDAYVPKICFIKGTLNFLVDKEIVKSIGLPEVVHDVEFRRTADTKGISFNEHLQMALDNGVPIAFFASHASNFSKQDVQNTSLHNERGLMKTVIKATPKNVIKKAVVEIDDDDEVVPAKPLPRPDIVEVVGYKTKDGKVFATHAEADSHNKAILRVEALEEWANEHLVSYDMRREDIVKAIIENLPSLIAALHL